LLVPTDSVALKAGPYELLSRESNVCKVKYHNSDYQHDKSDEQKIFAVVGTISLRFGHTLQLLPLGVAG